MHTPSRSAPLIGLGLQLSERKTRSPYDNYQLRRQGSSPRSWLHPGAMTERPLLQEGEL